LILLILSLLTPKWQRPFFSKNTSKLPFQAQEAIINNKLFFCIFNRKILSKTTRKTRAKSFAKFDHTDCEIITFEVEILFYFPCAQQGPHAFGAKFLNYANLRFCTIVMHIMLSTCVPNLRGRGWVEHMHLALKKGTIFFHNTSNSWEFLDNSLFL
jgi:hypothetical protein